MGASAHGVIQLDHLPSLLAAAPDPAVVIRLSGEDLTVVGGNEEFARLTGKPLRETMRRQLSSFLAESVAELVATAMREDVDAPRVLLDEDQPALVSDVAVTLRLAPTPSGGGQRLALLTLQTVRPVTDLGPHHGILDAISAPVIAAGLDFHIEYLNAAAAAYLGRTQGALLGTDVRRIATADDWSRLAELVSRRSSEGTVVELDHRTKQRRVAAVHVADLGDLIAITLDDRTSARNQEDQLAELHTVDPLTGLANRAGLANHIRHLAEAGNGRVLTLAFLDLDNFKTINDALGHDMGDQVLRTVGERLEEAIGGYGLVGRIGGDEFVVACSTAPGAGHGELEHLVALPFGHPMTLDGKAFNITASVGIAAAPSPQEADSERLLKAADLAMYEAKRRGKNTIAVYDESLEHRAAQRLEIESDLRRGIENDEFVVHYQPIMDVITGRPTGAEALVRWMHPRRGLVPPDQFIPVAEETGLIGQIGAKVLETAVEQVSAWNRDRLTRRALSISVNLSGVQLGDAALERSVHAALSRSGLDPAKLTLEVTESTLMVDVGETMATLGRLRDLGIGIAIDDFGTGYSSLAYLKSMPAQTLKIDKAFVNGLGTSPEDTALVTGIVALASALDFKVVAEGVENERQLRELRRLGCEASQGYLHSRPLPADEFEEWIRGRDQGSVGAMLAADKHLGTVVPGIEAASDPIAPMPHGALGRHAREPVLYHEA